MLIIFDCDGVLRSVSWEALHMAYLEIFKFINKNPDDFFQGLDSFKRWFDCDWQKNLEYMGVSRESDVSKINKIFHEIYDPSVQLFPWVGNILETLSAKHKLAVLSASSSQSVRNSLDGNADFFKMIVGYNHVKNIKPHPEGIHLIMKKFQANPLETLIIGDTNVDVLAGKNAGIKTAGVTWGLGLIEEIKACDPDFLFIHHKELLLI